MTEQGKFQVSQGFDVLPPRSGNAYPIPCEEWKALKSKISKITSEPWFFHTIGSLLLGVALSSFVTILLETFSAPDQLRALYASWGVVATTAISGLLCLFFANKERIAQRERATDVVAQMELIEKRYEETSS